MSYPASIKRLKGQGIIRRAAKHNLREIAAEIGVDRRIDAKRIHLNYVLRGPDTSEGIVSLRNSMLGDAGIKKLRSDAVEGLEVLFTWPLKDHECPPQYFEDCTRWAAEHFQVPILSSVVHLDESTPHCHLLMLPLSNGRMTGSALFGTARLLAMHLDAFYREVGAKYGIIRRPSEPKLSPLTRDYVIRTAQSLLAAISGLTEETIEIILKPHRKNPLRLAEHLKIALPVEVPRKPSKFVEMMTRPAPEGKSLRLQA
jgi:hypothetical protein